MAERTDKDCIAVLTRIAEPLVQALDLVIWGVWCLINAALAVVAMISGKKKADNNEIQ